jgi:hypothetical protein
VSQPSVTAREITEIEWQQLKAQRTAQTIIGGDPLVPYDLIGMANEIVSLRKQLEGVVGENARLREALERIATEARMHWRTGYVGIAEAALTQHVDHTRDMESAA